MPGSANGAISVKFNREHWLHINRIRDKYSFRTTADVVRFLISLGATHEAQTRDSKGNPVAQPR